MLIRHSYKKHCEVVTMKKRKKASRKRALERMQGQQSMQSLQNLLCNYKKLAIDRKLKSIEGWARHGCTMAEIAQMLGIDENTLLIFKSSEPKLSEALSVGAREADGEVLNAAFKQAVGYYAKQSEVAKLKKVAYEQIGGESSILRDSRGNPVLEYVTEVVEYQKFFEPDARMTTFLLSNRLKNAYQVKVVPESDSGGLIVQHCIPSGELDDKDAQD